MQIVFSGIGGQGILLATRVIAEYALSKGFNVIGSEVHGMAQRGGSVVSHLKIGDYKSPLVAQGEADLLISFDWHEGLKNLPFLGERGFALLNSDIDSTIEHPVLKELIGSRRLEIYMVDGYKIALEGLNAPMTLNVVMLGKLTSLLEDKFPADEIKDIIGKMVPHKYKDLNLRAFEMGRRAEVREVR